MRSLLASSPSNKGLGLPLDDTPARSTLPYSAGTVSEAKLSLELEHPIPEKQALLIGQQFVLLTGTRFVQDGALDLVAHGVAEYIAALETDKRKRVHPATREKLARALKVKPELLN